MQFTEPEVEFIGFTPLDPAELVKHIERAGRVCYKSEDKITSDSAVGFCQRIGARGHHSVLEHSNFVVRIPKKSKDAEAIIKALVGELLHRGRYHRAIIEDGIVYINGNIRAWHETFQFFNVRHDATNVNPLFAQASHLFYQMFGRIFPDHFILSSELGSPAAVKVVTDQTKVPLDLQMISARFVTDRGVTHEFVRHRPPAYSQESTRYVNYERRGMLCITVPWSWGRYEGKVKKALRMIEGLYNELINDGFKPEQARYLLPNGTKTEIFVTADLREWEHIIKLRTSPAAHPQIRELIGEFSKKLVAYLT